MSEIIHPAREAPEFGAEPGESTSIAWRRVLVASIVVLAFFTAVAGWLYHRNWVVMKWPIPAEPAVDDVPRLLRVATKYVSDRELDKLVDPIERDQLVDLVNQRRDAAHAAIRSVGSDAVPLLLEKLKAPGADGQVMRDTAARLLADLGENDGLGPYKTEVVATLTDMLSVRDPNVCLAAINALVGIGMPDASPALPAIKQKCLAADEYLVLYPDIIYPSFLFNQLLALDSAAAIPTLIHVLRDKEKYSLTIRVWAAGPLARAGGDRALPVPLIVALLDEVSERYRKQEMQRFAMEYVLHAVGQIRAVEALPQLMALLEQDFLASYERQTVVETLGQIGPGASAALAQLEMIADAPPETNIDPALRSAAVIAVCRIRLPEAAQAIPWILERVKNGLDATEKRDAAQRADAAAGRGYAGPLWEDDPVTKAYFCGLMLLGAQDDPKIMQYTGTPSWNNDHPGVRRILKFSPTLPRIGAALYAAIYLQESQALPDLQWTTDGRLLALAKAMSMGLEASDPSIRSLAAEVLTVLEPLTTSSLPELRRDLNDAAAGAGASGGGITISVAEGDNYAIDSIRRFGSHRCPCSAVGP